MKGLVLVLRMLFQAYRTALPAADKHQRSALSASTPPLDFASASVPATIDITLTYENADGRDDGHDAGRDRQQNVDIRETDDATILGSDIELSSLP
jgi:hypothetical protein